MNDELRQALEDLVNKFSIGDFVYNIRSRYSEGEEPEDIKWFKDNPDKSSWDHPAVVRYSECVEIIERFAKSA